jgi:hypothetical protein
MRADDVVPFSFDLSLLVRRSVASLYSHLVTRPTGRALRLGIESQIGELRSACVSVLDFTQVVVLDYSCADEAVAKLLQRFLAADRPAEAYFIARGLGEQHREPIEAVLERHHLALVAELQESGFSLLGFSEGLERAAWTAIQEEGQTSAVALARKLDVEASIANGTVAALAARRVVLPVPGVPGTVRALSTLVTDA